jgi:hypothetical protein
VRLFDGLAQGGIMEFDKSKILTVVTADQAKIGQKGWFASNVETLSRLVLEEQPKELLGFDSNNAVHAFKTAFQNHALFYPAPEPTYAERQAQWVKENNVKAGTKVRVTRTFTEDEDGSCCFAYNGLVGKTGVVNNISLRNLLICMDNRSMKAVPYFALEVIKEPTYRPFKNAEEFKPYRDEWFKTKIEEARTARAMTVNYSDSGVVMCWYDIHGNPELGCISWDGFFQSFKRENGDPCGVREEA